MHYTTYCFSENKGGGWRFDLCWVIIGIDSVGFLLFYDLFAYQYSLKMPLACYSKLPKSSKPEAIIKGRVSLYFRPPFW